MQQQWREESEERQAEEKKSEVTKERETQEKEDQSVRKGRKVAKHCVVPML